MCWLFRGSHSVALQRQLPRLPKWLAAVIDQGLIAVTNLTMSVAMARAGGISELGTYALVGTAMLMALGVTRMLVSEPWLASSADNEQPTAELRSIFMVAALASTIPTGLVAVVASGGRWEWSLAMPISCVWIIQDFGRFSAYKADKPAKAMYSDAAVLAGTILYLLVSGSVHRHLSVQAVLVAWLVGKSCGLLYVVWDVIGPLTVRGVGAWWMRVCRRLAVPLVHDSAAYMLGIDLSLYLLAAVSSTYVVGQVRVVSSMFSPVALAFTGLSMWLVPTLTRLGGRERETIKRKMTLYLVLLSVPMSALAVIFGPQVAVTVFGGDAPPSRWALLINGLSVSAVAIGSPWIASAKVRSHYAPIAWARTAAAAVILLGVALVPALQSAPGYLALLLIQNLSVLTAARLLCTEHPSDRQGSLEQRSTHSASAD